MKFVRRLKTTLLVMAPGLLLLSGTAVGQAPRQEPRYLYVFSSDARFLKMEAETFKLVDVGNLWWLGIRQVGGVIPDPRLQDVLLKVGRAWRLLGIENPTREQFDATTIAVLRSSHAKGKDYLAFASQPDGSPTVIEPPPESTLDVQGAKFFDLGKGKLFLTWDRREPYQVSVISYDAGEWYQPMSSVNNFAVYPRTCLTSDGQRLCTSVVGEPRDIECLDLNSEKVSRFSYESVGGEHYFSKTIVASGDCSALISVRTQREGAYEVFVYDIEKRMVRSHFQVSVQGAFHLLDGGSVILLNEEENVPNRLPDGSAGGMRRQGVGLMHVYDPDSGGKVATIQVPKASKLLLVSPDDKRGYLSSPGQLGVLDLENWKVLQTVEIPFESPAYLALVKATGR